MTVVQFRRRRGPGAQSEPPQSEPKSEAMQLYGDEERDSGVVAYDAGEDFIRLKFADGKIYRYTNESAGPEKIARMKHLAASGEGLLTYINKHVRDGYAERERRRR